MDTQTIPSQNLAAQLMSLSANLRSQQQDVEKIIIDHFVSILNSPEFSDWLMASISKSQQTLHQRKFTISVAVHTYNSQSCSTFCQIGKFTYEPNKGSALSTNVIFKGVDLKVIASEIGGRLTLLLDTYLKKQDFMVENAPERDKLNSDYFNNTILSW